MGVLPPLAPGWYPDQRDRRLLRYWDGAQWTLHTHPISPAVHASQPTSMAMSSSGTPWPSSGNASSSSVWQTWWVILPTLLLCFPVGLVFLWLRRGTSFLTKSLLSLVVVVTLVAAIASSGDSSGRDDVASEAISSGPTSSPETAEKSTEPESVKTAPPKAVVPKVVNLGLQRARSRLRRADLGVRIVERPSWRRVGVVLGQKLQAGSKVTAGKTIVLLVAKPMPSVPGVLGQPTKAAIAALRRAGFRIATTTQAVTTGAGGLVMSQTPAGTVQAAPGDVVNLVISRRVPSVAPPAPTNCTPGYSPCLAPASDYDCAGGSGDGPQYASGPIYVTGSDPYDLDSEGDGIACE
jgi:resuscitation-promoting factor RpfB